MCFLLIMQIIRSYVCPSQNVRLCSTNKWLEQEMPIFAYMHIDKMSSFAYFHLYRQCPWLSFSRSKIGIEYIVKCIMHLSLHGYRHIAICQLVECGIWPFDWHIYIWPRPIINVKVMYISIASLKRWQIGANITIAPNNMLHVNFRFAYLGLTLTYSKGQLSHRNGVMQNILAFILSSK